ncbi:MAG: flagellar M-ring protein FliF [Proteobacteria bacterium]|nr:flagellar M-ring protein FliF [Pseudomonadota bacterium]
MNAFIQSLRNLGPVRLAVIGGVGVALLAFVAYLLLRLGGTEMALLYTDLNPGDASKIVTRLDQLGVPYKLRGDGTEILVPVDTVPKTRITLAGEGLPAGGSLGYEIFDKSQGLATSSFVQNINQLRALEGELARTLTGIENVRGARVHLVLPQRELFSRERQEPSASIMLRMVGAKRLDKPQVTAIQHLVAAAVPGMKPERISIVDEHGTLLARGSDPSSPGIMLQTAEEMRIAYENRVARAVEQLLERTLGFGKVRAEVNADIDYSRTQENQEIFNPDQQVLRSTQTVNETAEQNESDSNPSVTVANNLPAGQSQQVSPLVNSSKSTRNEETNNFEITRTVRNLTREPGGIRRISVAVLVDGSYSFNSDGQRVYAPRVKRDLEQIESLVKSAVGYDGQRGDQVDVQNMQFAAFEDESKPVKTFFGLERQELIKIAEILVLGVVGALVLLLVVRPLIARLFESPETAAAGAAGLLGGPAAAGLLTGPGGTDLELAEGEEGLDEMIDLNRIEGRVKASSLRKIGEIVEKHPEDVVNIIRAWMYQET